MHKLAAPLAMLLALVILSPAAMALVPPGEDDSIYAAITYTAGSYDVGSKVDILVHVWEAGQYASAEGVEVIVGFEFMNPHTVPMTEQATGRWKGNFTILEGDVTGGSSSSDLRYVPVSADVIRGGLTVEHAFATIDLATIAGDRLTAKTTLSPASSYGTPGETRALTWLLRLGTTPVDAATMSVEVEGSDVTADRVAAGTYRYVYTYPSGAHSSSADITFRAEYKTQAGRSLDVEETTTLHLNFLHVWAKRVMPVTAAGATFDLYVSNWTGRPVAGATINLAYSYSDDDSNPIEKNLTASTDSNGVARVELVYNDLGLDEYEVEVGGNVSGQGRVQDLEFILFVRSQELNEPSPPDAEGFDVVSTELPLFKFGKAVEYKGTAYWEATAMQTSKVYYYLHSPNAVLANGELTTGATGALTVGFTTPQKGAGTMVSLYAHFETGINDTVQTQYYSDDEVCLISDIDLSSMQFSENVAAVLNSFHDDAVKVKVSTLKKGEPVPVTVTYAGSGDWECQVILGNDPKPASMAAVPVWTYWTKSLVNGFYSDTASFSDGKWQGAVFVPTNLPDKDFFVYGGLFNLDVDATQITDLNELIRINLVDGIEVGSSGGDGGGDGGGLGGLLDSKVLGIPTLLLIIIIIVIIVAGVAAGVVISRSRRAKPAPEATGEMTAAHPAEEGPKFESGPGPAAPMPGYQPQPQYAPQPEPQTVYAPQQPQYPAQPQYAAQQQYEAQPQYAPQPAAPQPQPQYAPPPQPQQPQPQQQWTPPPAPAPQPQYAPPPAPAPQPQYAPPPAQPAARPPAPQQPPATAPRPAAAPAAAAGAVSEMMTIKCQRCGTKLTIPRKRPIKVTCPNCGASGVLK